MKVNRFDIVLLMLAAVLGVGGIVLLNRQAIVSGALLGAGVALIPSVFYTAHERALQERQASDLKTQVAQLTVPAARTALRLGSLYNEVQKSPQPAARQRQDLAQAANSLEAWELRDYASSWSVTGSFYSFISGLDNKWPPTVGTAARIGYELVLSFELLKERQGQQAEANTALLLRDLAQIGIPSAVIDRAGALLRAVPSRSDPLPASQRELLAPRLLTALKDYVNDWLANVDGESDARLRMSERLLLSDEKLLQIQPIADGSEQGAAQAITSAPVQGTLLPPALQETSLLSLLAVGQIGFTPHWAMCVTEDGRCYLNGSYTFTSHPSGTSTMKVERKKEGFVVTVPPKVRYSPTDSPPWMGAGLADVLPVIEVHAEHDK